MLFHKPKQYSKQYTGLKFVIYIEMTDKFSLTSQCHKSTILHIMFKKLSGLVSYYPTTSQRRIT